jgi:AAA15 family ATPase/GTPase
MLKQVVIDGFKGFSNYSVDLRGINVLIGQNGSGKSTILSAIRLACVALAKCINENQGIDSYRKDNPSWLYCHFLPEQNGLGWIPVSNLDDLFYDRENGLTIHLIFDSEDSIQELKFNIDEGGNGAVDILCPEVQHKLGVVESTSDDWSDNVMKIVRDIMPNIIFVPPFYGINIFEEYRTDPIVEKMLMGGNHSQVVRNLAIRLDDEGLEKINDLLEKVMGLEISYMTPISEINIVEHLDVWLYDGEREIELANASAGVIALISLFAGIWRYRAISNRPVIFLIDEPEAHLNSKIQSNVGLYLTNLAHELGIQMIVSTHSVDMIDRMSQCRDTLLLDINKSNKFAIPLETESDLLIALNSWCNLTPFASLNVIRNKKILFYEGSGDASILNKCAELYFDSSNDLMQKYKEWSFVSLEGADNAAAKDILIRAITPIMLASPSVEKFYIVRVLDKDYTREKSCQVNLDGNGSIETLEVVWPRHSIESLFTDSECLLHWIQMYTETISSPLLNDEDNLKNYISESIVEANLNEELIEEARSQLMLIHSQGKRNDSALINASRTALIEVKKNPEIWQKGKKRGCFILASIRNKLHISHQKLIRRDIVRMVSQAPLSKDELYIEKLIPQEIRTILDYMVSK